VLKEIVVRLGNEAALARRDHSELAVPRNRHGMHRWKTEADIEALIRALARMMPDGAIASLLNRWGRRTAKGHTWTEARVRSFRWMYRGCEREERDRATLEQAAQILAVSNMTVQRMIRGGILPGKQLCKGAPWVIACAGLDRAEVRQAMAAGLKAPLATQPRSNRS
jgi:hypothetical protein